MNDDFLDMLRALNDAGARYLVVGAHALASHGFPRATGDLDIWVDRSPNNAERVRDALRRFEAPLEALNLTTDDFISPGNVIQLGLPPRRIDLLTSITGVEFAEAWVQRLETAVDGVKVPMLGREALVTNKRAVGRPQDLADVALLEAEQPGRPG